MTGPADLPKVSILIPVYNRESFIAECIQSALNQTYADFEVLVVDNASGDGTWEICQRFAALDHRVRVFRNDTNIGPVRNWRRCAEEARGEFSKILFSDDLLEPNCLAEMVPKLEDQGVALVYSAVRIGTTKSHAKLAYQLAKSNTLSSHKFISLALQHKAPGSPGATLFRTEDFLEKLQHNFLTATQQPFDQHGAGPDILSLFSIAEGYPTVAHISEPLVYFRVHKDSFTVSNKNNLIVEGYTSAISYYLKNKRSRREWFSYLADSWLRQLRASRKWKNMKTFLLANEGTGSYSERLVFTASVVVILIVKILNSSLHWSAKMT